MKQSTARTIKQIEKIFAEYEVIDQRVLKNIIKLQAELGIQKTRLQQLQKDIKNISKEVR